MDVVEIEGETLSPEEYNDPQGWVVAHERRKKAKDKINAKPVTNAGVSAPPSESALTSLALKEEFSDIADYEPPHVQKQRRMVAVTADVASDSDANATSSNVTPASSVPAVPESSKAVLSRPSDSVDAGAAEVVFYISFSLVLTGMALLYILMAAYGSCSAGSSTSHTPDDSSSRRRLFSDSNNSLPDRQPLLAGGHSPPGRPDSSDYELYSRVPWGRSGLTPSPVTGAKSDVGDGSTVPLASHIKSMPPLCGPAMRKAYSICASGIRGSSKAHRMGKRFVKTPTTMFPTSVLHLCSQDTPITFSAFLPNPDRSRFRWLAHGRHSEVFLVSSLLKRTVLKVMPVVGKFSQQRVEAITAAIECYLKLNALRHGMRFKAPNFIEVQRVACVFDHFPDCLMRNDESHASTESLADSLASEIAGTNDCCLTRRFVVFELCYAGKPLSRITLRSAVQGRSLVQQAACSVAVAERALGFRHLGVDADKLLVATTEVARFEYRFPGRDPLFVESAGLKVHLTGCLSCALQTEDKNDEDSEYREDSFGSPSSDCSGRAQPRFYGNVMWLGAVVDSVVHKLRSEVSEHRARSERAIIEEMLAWLPRLQQCNSAAEFVATTIA
ncbi:uncharacterized protein LOC142765811 [Rhipicephalus microplus]|uniref:uncharacterized protein LOC142765811 n=1 Tax=Rhipicephalus microplus TaxID=6941 RepID=UPI003F6C319D